MSVRIFKSTAFSPIAPNRVRISGYTYKAFPVDAGFFFRPEDCPQVDVQPEDQGGNVNESASFSVVVSTTDGVTYQWQYSSDDGVTWQDLTEGSPYIGTKTDTLTVDPLELSQDGYMYRAVAFKDGCNDLFSGSAELTVSDVCPNISDQPDDETIFATEGTSFAVVASVSMGSIAYQWEASGDDGGSWSPLADDSTYSGVATDTMTITNAAAGLDGYLYRCVLSNMGCDVISDFATLTVIYCSAITVQPVDASADACSSTSFSVTLDFVFPGTTYQWQVSTNSGGAWSDLSDGSDYSNVTTDTLSIDTVPFGGDGYWYRCVISNSGCADVNSGHGVLTVVEDAQVAQWVGYVNAAGGGFASDSLDIARELVCQINLSGFANKIQWLLPFLGTGIGAARAPLIDRLGDGLTVNNNFVNGDFSQSTGLQGNGTNKTFDTGIKFTDLGTSSQSGIGWWENNINLAGNVHPMGNYALGLFGQYRYVLDLRSSTQSYVYGATATNACGLPVSSTNGNYYGQRSSGSVRKIFVNGVQTSTNTFVGAENGVGSQTIVICGSSNQSGVLEPWPGRCAVAYMTDGTLTDGEVATFHQLLIDYLFTPTGRPYT